MSSTELKKIEIEKIYGTLFLKIDIVPSDFVYDKLQEFSFKNEDNFWVKGYPGYDELYHQLRNLVEFF